MISVTEAVYLLTIWPIYREYGWQIFKTLGADRRIKKCYAWFQVFICILKFGGHSSPPRTLRLVHRR